MIDANPGSHTLAPEVYVTLKVLPGDDVLETIVKSEPADTIRNDCPVPLFTPFGNLKVWSSPNTAGDTIVTRISIVEGHVT